ncbi:MAG: glycosyltransferase family 2 protein [Bacteroidetes bacterium]|nr:glycosyltransferase family 2 protein [Bacteroidota bacterium]
MPKVSIVIPVYNGSKYLAGTVHSVLDQEFEDWEMLIIDDGSTDNTKEIAFDLQNKESRITVYLKEKSGVSDTRNYGMQLAGGEFIVFLDADDIVGKDFLKSRLDALTQNENTAVCGSMVACIDEYGKVLEEHITMQAPQNDMVEEILFYKDNVTTIPSNLMFRKDVLTNNNIQFDRRLSSSADRMLLCKVGLVSACIPLQCVNVFYRIHPESMYNALDKKKQIFKDNELFVHLLLKERIVPKRLMNEFLKRNYYMLCGAAVKSGYYLRALLYGLKYEWVRIIH